MIREIAAAEPCDAVAVARVINAAYRVEDFFKNGDRTDPHEIAELLLVDTVLVSRDEDDAIVGCVRVSIHRSTAGSTDSPKGHFGMLAVAPSAQGTGLGRTLVQAAEDYCRSRGCTSMDLEVASPRLELPPFYRKLGYEITGTADWPVPKLHELKSPAHFIIMSKMFAAPATPEHPLELTYRGSHGR